MNLITRYNRKWVAPKKKATPIKFEFELVTIIEPLSFNEDKTIKEYKETQKYVLHESKWQDFIDSYDIGSISQQVMDHITKGTPLITGHTLPAGDYTPESLEKGARIKKELDSKGITLDMIVDALNKAKNENQDTPVVSESEANNG